MTEHLRAYVQKQIQSLWSTVLSVEQVIYQGRVHFKITSKMLWYQTLYYAKFTLVKLPKALFLSSQFFNCFPFKEDIREEISNEIILSKYVLIVQEHHMRESSCKGQKLSYKPKDIYLKLMENIPLLYKFMDISYENFEYHLLRFPLPLHIPYSLKDIASIAQSQNLKQNECQVVQYFGSHQAKIININQVKKLLKHKGRISKIIGHSHRFIVYFAGSVFVKEFATIYYLQQVYQKQHRQQNKTQHKTEYEEQFFTQGKQFSGLFLLGSDLRIVGLVGLEDKFAQLKNNELSDEKILSNIFSRKLSRCKKIYKDTSQQDFDKVFKAFSFQNKNIEAIQQLCYVGDILYIDRGVYHHVGTYLGADLLIHVSVGTFSGITNQKATRYQAHNQLTGKLFQFDNFQSFANDKEQYKMQVRRLYFCPFTRQQILQEAIVMRELYVTYDPHSRNCEHLAVELMTGKPYSSQAGLLSFLIKPIVKAGIYNISW